MSSEKFFNKEDADGVFNLFLRSWFSFFAVGVWILSKKPDVYVGWACSIVGVVLIVIATFLIAPLELLNGLPKTSIDAGEYKVAFVYVAGENVNVGIEKTWSSDKEGKVILERLHLYQFPKSAFDGNLINTKARKLVVVKSGKFRKLVLE